MSTQARLRTAKKLAQSGRPGDAAAIYREILTDFPSNKIARQELSKLELGLPKSGPAGTEPPAPVFQQLLALAQARNFTTLAERARELTRAYPKSANAWSLLAQGLQETHRFDAALKANDKALAITPQNPRLHAARAACLLAMGHMDAAEAAARNAHALGKDPRLALELAGALGRAGRIALAEALLSDLRTPAEALPYWVTRANVLSGLGLGEAALDAFGEALALQPDNGELHAMVGAEYAKQDRLADALAAFERADAKAPGSRRVLDLKANALQTLGLHRDALAALDAAGADDPAVTLKRAQILWELGDRETANRDLDRLAQEAPTNIEALTRRALFAPPRPETPEFAQLEKIAADEAVPPALKLWVLRALYLACDKAGDPAKAFAALDRANGMRRALARFDMDGFRRTVDAITRQFGAEVPQLDGPTPAPRPLFIVGMPRSGTTLVEQILSNHSAVKAAGELSALRRAVRLAGWRFFDPGPVPTSADLETIARSYRRVLSQIGEGKEVVTDKAPLNLVFVGHALSALPDARVLILDRDPMATCWSNQVQFLTGTVNGFGADVAQLAETHALADRLKSLWVARFPDRVTRLSYEALTADPEPQVRALLDAAGLRFEDACLTPETSRRAVRTASSEQVRDGIYTGSSEAWRRYEPQLAPLKAALERHGVL